MITKLLEAAHGQWVQIHDTCKGTQATLQKEELQKEIEAQQEMGYHGLLDEDLYLVEVNLEDLESTSGEQQEYWLVAIHAAWEARLLSEAAQQHMGCIVASQLQEIGILLHNPVPALSGQWALNSQSFQDKMS